MKIPDDYELTEADIDTVIRYLKIRDPKNATPEQAIDFLEFMRVAVHEFAHQHPDRLEALYAEFTKNPRTSSPGQA